MSRNSGINLFWSSVTVILKSSIGDPPPAKCVGFSEMLRTRIWYSIGSSRAYGLLVKRTAISTPSETRPQFQLASSATWTSGRFSPQSSARISRIPLVWYVTSIVVRKRLAAATSGIPSAHKQSERITLSNRLFIMFAPNSTLLWNGDVVTETDKVVGPFRMTCCV
jgi:hypothetical protein